MRTGTARLILAVCIGLGLGFGLFQLSQGFDADAYWLAAQRLRDGEPLYLPGSAADPTVYRYPPWFAWAWVSLTYLPYDVVMVAWRVGLVLAAASIVPAVWHSRWGLLGAVLFVPWLAAAGWMGNVQSALVALTVWGGVWGVGVAGGVKAVPLLLTGAYAWRGQWRSTAIAVGVAAVLWAPTLLYDLSGYPAPRGFWPTDLAFLLALTGLLDPLNREAASGGHRGSRR